MLSSTAQCWAVLISVGKRWPLKVSVGQCWRVLGSVGQCFGSVEQCWGVLGCTGECWAMLGSVGQCWARLGSSGQCWVGLGLMQQERCEVRWAAITAMFADAGRVRGERELGQQSCRCGSCTAEPALASAAVQTRFLHEHLHALPGTANFLTQVSKMFKQKHTFAKPALINSSVG